MWAAFIVALFTHWTPNVAGAALSIHQQHGIHVVPPGYYRLKPKDMKHG